MATFKSNTRTVLNTTLSSSSSYSSGPLNVGDLNEIVVACTVSSVTIASGYIYLYVSRIMPDGNLYTINWLTLSAANPYWMDIGSGLTNALSFGDQIQLDLSVTDAGNHVSTTVCILGKS